MFVIFVCLWAINNPAQLNSRSTAALLARRHSYAERAPSAVAKQQYWLSCCLSNANIVRDNCDELSCFLNLKMNLCHPCDGNAKAHDITVRLSLKA